MAYADKTIRFVVSSGVAAVAPNTVLAVGTNQMQDARPAGFGAGQWAATMFFQYTGGDFVPGFGAGGCFAMAGHGGHSAGDYQSVDASVFDFADYTWKYLPNTNGITHNPYQFTEADVDGSGDQALIGSSGACPPPSHTYRLHTGIGSSLYLPRIVYGLQSGNGGARAWRCALNYGAMTCTWSRETTNNANSQYVMPYDQEWITSFYDPLRARIWQFSGTFAQATSVATYRPGIDTAWSASNYSGLSGLAMQENAGLHGDLVYDSVRDCIWLLGADGQLYRMNLANPPAAMTWTAQSSTGLVSVGTTGTGSSRTKTRWHLYPSADGGDDCLYTHAHAGQSVLKKFDPVTRTFSLVTITNGPTMPSWDTGNPGHYSRFFYVPHRKCFAWIPGGASSVYLVRP